ATGPHYRTSGASNQDAAFDETTKVAAGRILSECSRVVCITDTAHRSIDRPLLSRTYEHAYRSANADNCAYSTGNFLYIDTRITKRRRYHCRYSSLALFADLAKNQ